MKQGIPKLTLVWTSKGLPRGRGALKWQKNTLVPDTLPMKNWFLPNTAAWEQASERGRQSPTVRSEKENHWFSCDLTFGTIYHLYCKTLLVYQVKIEKCLLILQNKLLAVQGFTVICCHLRIFKSGVTWDWNFTQLTNSTWKQYDRRWGVQCY